MRAARKSSSSLRCDPECSVASVLDEIASSLPARDSAKICGPEPRWFAISSTLRLCCNGLLSSPLVAHAFPPPFFVCARSVYTVTTPTLRKGTDDQAEGVGGLYMQDSEPVPFNPAVK